MESENTPAAVRNSALSMISRREFCRAQLTQRLLRKHPEAHSEVESVLDWLEELSYLDDQRFTAMFLRTAIAKRRGPNRIKIEMQRLGLTAQVIENSLNETEVDWFALAQDSLQSKFRKPCVDMKDKSKRYRYLQAQGFVSDHIQYALANYDESARLAMF